MPGQATVLNSKEITEVLKLLDSPRDKTIFSLGVYTGMRISEILSLEQDPILTADGGVKYMLTVKRLKKKNTVSSDIPVHLKLRAQLKEYKKPVKSHQYLFPSRQSVSSHISSARAHQILNTIYLRMKLQGAKTHSMRRTFLTGLSRAGIPLRTIQKMSGHSNLGQLQDYLEVDEGDKHRAINLLKY